MAVIKGTTIIKHFEKNVAQYNRRRWEHNIKMDLQEVGCLGTNWIELAEDRDSGRALVTAVMKLRVP